MRMRVTQRAAGEGVEEPAPASVGVVGVLDGVGVLGVGAATRQVQPQGPNQRVLSGLLLHDDQVVQRRRQLGVVAAWRRRRRRRRRQRRRRRRWRRQRP